MTKAERIAKIEQAITNFDTKRQGFAGLRRLKAQLEELQKSK